MQIGYSINQRDEDGDPFDTCVLIHIDNNIILRFKNYDKLSEFVDKLSNMKDEVRESWKMYNEEELFL